jgi:hypothetical protein
VFVSELSEGTGDSNIVVAIVQLARSLNLAVIAEGVETEEQLELLRGYGCDSVQGYVFAPALSPARFERGVLRNPVWMADRTQRLQVPVFAAAGADELADRTIPAQSLRGRTPPAPTTTASPERASSRSGVTGK